MLMQFRQGLPILVAGLALAYILPRLGSLSTLFFCLAALGWLVILGWLLLGMNVLPAQVRAALPARLVPATTPPDRSRSLTALVTGARVRQTLARVLEGQAQLIEAVAGAVESLVHRKTPGRPLSILITGPPGSGRTLFAKSLGEAVSAAGEANFIDVSCASDATIDLADVLQRFPARGLPVIFLDHLHTLDPGRRQGLQIMTLKRLLERGVVESRAVDYSIVVATAQLGEASSAEVHHRAATDPGAAETITRQTVTAANPTIGALIPHFDYVCVMKPLTSPEMGAVVWEAFRNYAWNDYGILIVQDELTLETIVPFVMRGVSAWQGEASGARAATRFIASASEKSLIKARQSGYRCVRPVWDAVKNMLACLQMADAPDPNVRSQMSLVRDEEFLVGLRARLAQAARERDNRRFNAPEIAEKIKQRVIGQDAIADIVASEVARKAAKRVKDKPLATILISGPTGTGKSEMAKAISEAVFGSEDFMLQIDCGNMGTSENSMTSLVGLPEGYQNATRGVIADYLTKTKGRGVILFDEFDKAAPHKNAPLAKMLLKLMDEAKFQSLFDMNVTYSATECIIILTSNLKQAELGKISRQALSPEALESACKRILSDSLAPEFLERLDLVTTTAPLTDESMALIVMMHFERLARSHGLTIKRTRPNFYELLVQGAAKFDETSTRGVIRWLGRTCDDALIEAANDHHWQIVTADWDGQRLILEEAHD